MYFRLFKKLKLRRLKNYKIEPHLTCDRKKELIVKSFKEIKARLKKKILNNVLKCKYAIKYELFCTFIRDSKSGPCLM